MVGKMITFERVSEIVRNELNILKAKKRKSTVNKAGNYTKPTMRKRMFARIKAGSKGGAPGQWSARKAQLLASRYKKAGGGYRK
jgi:hypothetical protein|tara:strand:+ start:1193 stop:1444 length:252 start_codon:yes stop_codon:yes gene_type:complete